MQDISYHYNVHCHSAHTLPPCHIYFPIVQKFFGMQLIWYWTHSLSWSIDSGKTACSNIEGKQLQQENQAEKRNKYS